MIGSDVDINSHTIVRLFLFAFGIRGKLRLRELDPTNFFFFFKEISDLFDYYVPWRFARYWIYRTLMESTQGLLFSDKWLRSCHCDNISILPIYILLTQGCWLILSLYLPMFAYPCVSQQSQDCLTLFSHFFNKYINRVYSINETHYFPKS